MNHKYIFINYELRIFLIIKFKNMNHSFHSFVYKKKYISMIKYDYLRSYLTPNPNHNP